MHFERVSDRVDRTKDLPEAKDDECDSRSEQKGQRSGELDVNEPRRGTDGDFAAGSLLR